MTERDLPVTVPVLQTMKEAGRKITMLTAYDYPTARALDRAGVDALLVGDSLGMVVGGHDTTLSVTLDQIIYHAEMVVRATERALVVVDLPFPAFHISSDETLRNAARVLKETGCHAVKMEGGASLAETIARLTAAGIPVMAHIGLLPQRIHQAGGYRVQRDREQLLEDAKAVERAGAFAVVMECISASIAAEITPALRIPTIGIGAGPDCDGQVLVVHDLLGFGDGMQPKHVRRYADLQNVMSEAVREYCEEVRQKRFPGQAESFR